MKRFCAVVAVLLCAYSIWAQEPAITPDMPVDSAMLLKWLHSGDPRLVTWAADFAHRNHDAAVLAAMSDWLQHWPMPPLYGNNDRNAGQELAITKLPIMAVLDALIQEKVKASIPAIDAVAPAFPEQAAILVTRYPVAESSPTLDKWTLAAQGTWSQRLLAKVAFMLLAKEPTTGAGFCNENWTKQFGFVASTMACSEVRLQITVSADGKPGLSAGGNVCGDSEGRVPSPGWPKVYSYLLLENDSADLEKPALLDLNGDRISVLRYVSNGVSQTGCHSNTWLDPHFLWHQMIAYWTGVQPQDMPWQPLRSVGIKWSGKTEYQQQLAKLVDSERRAMQDTVVALRKRGLVTAEEASMIGPRIVVTIDCQVRPCPLD